MPQLTYVPYANSVLPFYTHVKEYTRRMLMMSEVKNQEPGGGVEEPIWRRTDRRASAPMLDYITLFNDTDRKLDRWRLRQHLAQPVSNCPCGSSNIHILYVY